MGCFLLRIIFVHDSEPRKFLAKCFVFGLFADKILALLYCIIGDKDKGISSTTHHVINDQTLLNSEETSV